ncbi:MAG: alpha/beta fold hydrolase [Aeromicrobium sp.]|uniref:alpha/beta fold hydrolase n=1 Tax=Aeromicrobium sp. TaxID=1871063 RepID=UPI0026222E6C|nr:alpha/beta fold hydrolase [Aeromicrobium sp.]MDF1704767.1 alpha/beta fold hydrolase [Aeromicrobium sp.]
MSKKLWIIGGLVLALIVAGSVTAVLLLTSGDDERADPQPTAESDVPEGLEKFYTQEVDWEDCGTDRCADVTVPIDYAAPDGETTEVRMRVIGDSDAEQHLFVNPGGPGGSALDYATTMSYQLGDDVLDTYAIVGVDPRGVGKSSPLECYDDEQFDAYVNTDPTPDDPAEVQEAIDQLEGMAEACEENSGELAGHVSTVEVARDMDIARALVGDSTFNWFGASYGTYLGATYAALFPEKVGRMVLDGAINPELGPVESALGQATGFQRALEAYIADCVTESDCPLGTDEDAAEQRLTDLLAQLDAQPMPTGDPDRPLTEGQAFFGVALPLYAESLWPELTTALTLAIGQGDGSGLQYLSDVYFERSPKGSYGSNAGQVITAVNCLDATERPTYVDVEPDVPDFAAVSPVFGRALALGAAGCSAWPFESSADPVDFSAAGAPPILVLGTTRDPATPYEQAVELADILDSGVLISRDGDGHTAYQSGNRCVTDAVDAYLVDGTVPKKDPEC